MKKHMIFFAPDAGGEGGGGGDGTVTPVAEPVIRGTDVFTPAKTGTGDRPLPIDKKIDKVDPQQKTAEGDVSQGPSGAATGDGKSQPIPFDPSKFAKEIGEAFGTKVAETKPVKQELSAEEAKKLLNIWEPDDAWYKKYDNLETRGEAMKEQRDGLIKQADTIAQLRMHELIEALKTEIAPQLKSVSEFAQQQREDRFNKAYPVLAKPELKPLIVAVANDMASKGQKFTNEGEMFKALASGVEGVIKATNPDFKLAAGSSPASNNSRTNNSIPTTTPGSGGGIGRSTGEAQKSNKPRGLSVFD